ncbi:alpha-L-rhamnosidase [Paramicrobacterium humi]|uniref:alpha-L-rhamnosidase n=1 Tax=Paramicrobacterium humi TaxID=640635 RepID=A0A1H4TIA5_9MICO|nr:glycoside hydrolase family 78 protein [Microbacterium humi]SEC55834.1 alpha-L-rhamnosidase [Microbacterium humi]
MNHPALSEPASTTFATRSASTFVAAPFGRINAAPYFRREFTVGEGLVRATLSVTALGIVEPYLNGRRVGSEMLTPGWTSYRHRLIVTTIDVTDDVRPGQNAVGAIVGDGWAIGRLGWERQRHLYADQPALFVELELDYSDHTIVIGTDDSFRVSTGAVQANSLYDGETYDARLEPEGWNEPGFDDSAWSHAQVVDWDLTTLERRTAPPIRRIEELAPAAITTSPSGKIIVDFGQNISGWLNITVSGEAGREITIRHAEILTPAGELEPETNRTAEATDRYTLRGDAIETWEPRFTFHGFRFAQIDGWPGKLAPDAVRAVVVHTDMVRTGWFETSNPLVTKLHSNVVWSMRDNFVGVPTDCPQRDERLGWTGDLNAFAPTAAFLYDVREMLGSWLQDLAAEQTEKGFVPWVVPDALSQPSSPTALWSDVAVSLPWLLYQEYGDLEILRDCYASMTAFIRQVAALLDESGLWSSGFQFGDWLDPDAPASNPAAAKTDRHLVASAFLCKTTREMSATAELLGHKQDARAFLDLANRVRAAFRREYVTESGRLVSESATAYALAITFEILDADQLQKAGDQLAQIVAQRGYRISTGFAGTPLVTDALSRTGHIDTAYRLLLEEECPSFLYPVTMGATTIWERWDSVLPDGTVNATGMTSLNHYALGAVADWLHRVVGGLERIEPGYKRVRIAPQPGGDLTWVRTVHDTIRGRFEVSWKIEGGEVVVDVTIPHDVEADIVLPFQPQDAERCVGEGVHSWRYPVSAGYGATAAVTMDSPIRDLTKRDGAWEAVSDVLQRYFPGLPLDPYAPEAAAMSLNAVLQHVPGASPVLENELKNALAIATQ